MVTWCHVLLGWAPGRRPGGLSAVTRPGLGLLTYYEPGTFLGACGDMGHPERVTKDAGTPLPLKLVLPEEGTLILEENPLSQGLHRPRGFSGDSPSRNKKSSFHRRILNMCLRPSGV